jgi:malonyl-CoA O-methyltransferase
MKDFRTQTNLSRSRVRQSFRRGLVSYHAGASVQARIARHLSAMLAEHAGSSFERVFEFGCGTGHLTRALTENHDISELWLNDLVPDCAGAALAAVCGTPRVRFQAGDVHSVELPGVADLIASASTVQWIEDQPRLLARLSGQLAEGGWLALSGFGSAQFHELAAMGSTAGAPGYRDAEEWDAILPADMELVAVHQTRIIRYFDTARDVLRHLRETGVNGNAQGGWTRARLAGFEAEYEARFRSDEGLTLTYDPVWILARKR